MSQGSWKLIETAAELNQRMVELRHRSQHGIGAHMLAPRMRPIWETYLNGMDQLDSGMNPGALQIFRSVSQAWPDFAEVYLSMGLALANMKNYREALDVILRKGHAVAPKWHMVHFHASGVYDEMGDHVKEAEQLKLAIAEYPDHRASLWNLSHVYMHNLRDADGARHTFQQFLKVASNSFYATEERGRRATAYRYLAHMCAFQRDFDEAENFFNQSLRLELNGVVRAEQASFQELRSKAEEQQARIKFNVALGGNPAEACVEPLSMRERIVNRFKRSGDGKR